MSDKRRAKQIYDRWKSGLINLDKSYNNISNNFDNLFFELYSASVVFDVAEDFIKDATAAHMPSLPIAKRTYSVMSSKTTKHATFNEFYKSWKDGITDKAKNSFYSFFSLEGDEEEEKKFGSMSKQEYTKQRKYAEQFPPLDINAIPDDPIGDMDFDLDDLGGDYE